MKNSKDAYSLGVKAFYQGKFKGQSGLSGWRLKHWTDGWTAAHDGKEENPDVTTS